MSASRERIRHVYAATRDLLDALHPGTGDAWVWRFRRRFIAPASVFESGAHVLEDMDMPKADALLLSLIPGIARYTRMERFGRSPRLDTLGKAGGYLKGLFLGRAFEHFYMLSLDASGRLLACVFLAARDHGQRPILRAPCARRSGAHARACHRHQPQPSQQYTVALAG